MCRDTNLENAAQITPPMKMTVVQATPALTTSLWTALVTPAQSSIPALQMGTEISCSTAPVYLARARIQTPSQITMETGAAPTTTVRLASRGTIMGIAAQVSRTSLASAPTMITVSTTISSALAAPASSSNHALPKVMVLRRPMPMATRVDVHKASKSTNMTLYVPITAIALWEMPTNINLTKNLKKKDLMKLIRELK